MTWADVLPYFNTAAAVLTVGGSAWWIARTQNRQFLANAEIRAAQHGENIAKLSGFDRRLENLEKNGERQTEILIGLAEIKGDIKLVKGDVDGIKDRLDKIENREAGRRIAAKG